MARSCYLFAAIFIIVATTAAFGAPDMYYQETITDSMTYQVTYLPDEEGTIWWEAEYPGVADFGIPTMSLTYEHSITDIDPPVLPDGMIKSARLKLYLRNGADESITLMVDSIDLEHVRRRHFLIGPSARDSVTVEDSPLADGKIIIDLYEDDREFILVRSVFDLTYKPATPSGADDNGYGSPMTFRLGNNYPNPFNPSTTIDYDLAISSHVTIDIFNVAGQKIRTLVDEHKAPGSHSVVWNGIDDAGGEVASGVYLYRLQVGEYLKTKQMMLVK